MRYAEFTLDLASDMIYETKKGNGMGTITKIKGKKGVIYRAEVRLRGGYYHSENFKTKADAKGFITSRENDYLEGIRGESTRHTFREALEKYRDKVSPEKRGGAAEVRRINAFLHSELFKNCLELPFREIRDREIFAWRDGRLKEVSTGTVRREWNLLQAIFAKAHSEWKWIPVNIMQKMAKGKRPEDGDARTRRLASGEMEKLYAAAEYVDGQQPAEMSHYALLAFALAVETAMRANEIRSLRPSRIRLAERVAVLPKRDPETKKLTTKTGVGREVPLTTRAVAIVTLLMEGVIDDQPLIPMSADALVHAFIRLYEKAGIKALTFRDSRAEGCTRLAEYVPIITLQRIAGHTDINMLKTYYRKSAADIAKELP